VGFFYGDLITNLSSSLTRKEFLKIGLALHEIMDNSVVAP